MKRHVASGAAIIAARAAQASRYRPFGLDLRPIILRADANKSAIDKPCQRKWTSVQPRRSTHASDESICMAFITNLLSLFQTRPAGRGFRPALCARPAAQPGRL